MPKGSDTSDVQSNGHIYCPANGEAKINCVGLSGYVWVGKGVQAKLPLQLVVSSIPRNPQSFTLSQRA